ncbi:MAG: hypothetical protein UT98_C0002G0177, partial [Candidatus Nomurabacteria bacterium GW2011_GWF2_40_31]
SIYLDEDIEREIYLERKDLLMREKASLLESERDFGQQRKNWVEPLRSFVLSLKECADLEKTENYLEWKQFFQKIGSNSEIKDKTVLSLPQRAEAGYLARVLLHKTRSLFLISRTFL